MKFRATCPALLLGCTLALPAGAQSMKPGLWEVTSKSSSGDGMLEQAMAELQKQMETMPPEQRKMMQEMMAKQGASIDAANNSVTAKVCVTKEMVANKQLPVQVQGDCTTTHNTSGANSMDFHFNCTNPMMQGDGKATFSGDTSYTMTMKFTTSVAGKPQTMSTDASARWLASDCGKIKPVQMPMTK